MAYITIDDLRDEGFDACGHSDRRMQKAITQAEKFVERITGRWFEPRELTIDLDGQRTFEQLVEFPIIDVFELRHVANDGSATEIVPVGEYALFNRHVRQGLLQPDDRENARISFKRFEDDILVRPPTGAASAFPEFSRFFDKNFQNVRVFGLFGFTDPDFTAGRTVATDGADAITTSPNRITMTNGAFTSLDLASKPVIAGSASNDGTVTVRRIISSTVIEVAETLVPEGDGFTLTIPTFPQGGETPEEIKRATLLLAAKRLGKLATEDPIEDALSGGRVRRMKVRDQEIQFSADSRVANGEASWSGDPEVDSILASYMRPPRIGAA